MVMGGGSAGAVRGRAAKSGYLPAFGSACFRMRFIMSNSQSCKTVSATDIHLDAQLSTIRWVKLAYTEYTIFL